MSNQYQVVVLGAGPGGYVAAIRAAQLGLKTAVIEKEYWGGVCLNIGCIPSKALLKNAEVAHTLKHRGKEFGFSFDNLNIDYGVAFKRSRQVSDRLVKGIGFLMKKNNIDTIEGSGTLTNANTIKVQLNDGGEQEVTADNIIIATGARPRLLPGAEVDGRKIITYVEAITSDTLPKRAVIIGGGAIGVEFAYVWANYGVDVTIIEMLPRILPNEEPEVSSVIEKAYKKLKIDLKTDTTVKAFDTSGEGVKLTLSDDSTLECDQVMIAINFIPNTENIGLETVGVKLTERGAIDIDSSMRTSVPNIYAIGDVATEYKLAHIASAMGIVAAETIAELPYDATRHLLCAAGR